MLHTLDEGAIIGDQENNILPKQLNANTDNIKQMKISIIVFYLIVNKRFISI